MTPAAWEAERAARARRAAREQRKRDADGRLREAIDGPERAEQKRAQEAYRIARDVAPAAADALREMRRWRRIVEECERVDDEAEAARARRTWKYYRGRWVLLAATHPRLRGFVAPADLSAHRDLLEGELARAYTDYNAAVERLRELQARRRRGEQVSDHELYELDTQKELARARVDLERDAVEHRKIDRRRRTVGEERLSAAERKRLARRRDLEAFLAAKTREAIASGLHPDAVKAWGGRL